MRIFALLFLLLLAAAPPAIPPDLASNPAMVAAEHAAEALLTPCRMPTTPLPGTDISANDFCSQNQQFFIQQYVRALSGSLSDALAEASDYSELGRTECAAKPKCTEVMASQWIGIPADQVWACAWSKLARALEKPSEMALAFRKVYGRWPPDFVRTAMRTECEPLSAVESIRATDRAVALVQRIADDPISLPSPGWWLPWPTIAPFEGHS